MPPLDRSAVVSASVASVSDASVSDAVASAASEINENGEMVVSGFDQEMPWLSYIVGTVSDHTLTIHEEEISLRELCGRNSKVKFSCEHRFF